MFRSEDQVYQPRRAQKRTSGMHCSEKSRTLAQRFSSRGHSHAVGQRFTEMVLRGSNKAHNSEIS